MYGHDELFWKETIEGFQKKQFPKNYFHKSIAKNRGKALIEYFCELDGRMPEEIYQDLNDEWIEKYKINKFEKYLPLKGTTQFDRVVDLFRITYPYLPEFDVHSQIITWHLEILSGKRRAYPYKCFEGRVGRDRAVALLKHFKRTYHLAPEEITTEVLQKYRIPVIHVLASNLAELQMTYQSLSV